MNVLLTNDDGIYARGLWALYNRFAINHRAVVVAPTLGLSGGAQPAGELLEARGLPVPAPRSAAAGGAPAGHRQDPEGLLDLRHPVVRLHQPPHDGASGLHGRRQFLFLRSFRGP